MGEYACEYTPTENDGIVHKLNDVSLTIINNEPIEDFCTLLQFISTLVGSNEGLI